MIDDLACLMYLLAYDDTAEGPYDRSRTELLVRAAALVDLASRGRLGEDRGTVTVLDAEPTGIAALDAILGDAAGRSWKRLIRRRRKQTLRQVEGRLVAAGLLTVKPRSGFRTRGPTMADRSVPVALRARVSDALHGDGTVAELPTADAALVALAAAGGVHSAVSRRDRRISWARIDACTGRLAALGPGLEQAVRTLPMTMVAARGGMGGA
ncbi:GPP34 family phosphoprotein [Streptomyces sp. NPDC086787]|uniref:GOLPH3/VPS74 family protein n=1 Tax=Streptomyces sp. NPDC086787 TaxID=3365759 RepID=UPI0038070B14